MSTYVLLHGAGTDSWYWHLVVPRLRSIGHDVVAPDLPSFDGTKRLPDYTRVATDAIGDRRELIVVGQSVGAFTAVSVCTEVPAELLVFLNGMVPAPGETAGEWWDDTGHASALHEHAISEGRDPDADFDPAELFLHDVPRSLWEASARHAGPQARGVFEDAAFDAWPDVAVRAIVARGDRFFPAAFQRRLIRERLGIEPDEIEGGHLTALSRPAELVELLETIRRGEHLAHRP